MLPLSLLRAAVNHPVLIELKNGETYNGELVNVDNWMNVNLKAVICTAKHLLRVRGARLEVSSGQHELFRGKAGTGTNCVVYHTYVGGTREDGDHFWKMKECYVRGSSIKFLRVPDEVSNIVKAELARFRNHPSNRRGGFVNHRGGRGGGPPMRGRGGMNSFA